VHVRKTAEKRSMAHWLVMRVWTLLPNCRRVRTRTTSTAELVTTGRVRLSLHPFRFAEDLFYTTCRKWSLSVCLDVVDLSVDLL